ncbi:ribosylnicotinamide kinase, partial [Dimargaris verticillata]
MLGIYSTACSPAPSGPSCAGKTTLARQLQHFLPNCHLIHQDDFYKNDQDIPIDPDTGLQSWDCDDAFCWDQLMATITQFRNTGKPPSRESKELPSGNLKLSTEAMAHCQKLSKNLLKPTASSGGGPILLVDGIMLFHRAALDQLFDCRLLVTSTYSVIKKRREGRLGYATIEGWWTDPPQYFDNIVWPAYQSYFEQIQPRI